ncbi:MAG: hypothetical protein JNM56_27600 [Planctomycetia bacterium]|nr:hypothetical protein [Planctomycetia bacterium]
MPAAAYDEKSAAVGADEVELTLLQVGEATYPCQPVRIRVVLRNVSNRVIGPIRPLEYHFLLALKKPPPGAKWEPVEDMSNVLEAKRLVKCQAFFTGQRQPPPPLFLRPREQISLSFSLSVMRDPSAKNLDLLPNDIVPLFPVAGEYQLQFSYPRDVAKAPGGAEWVYLRKELAIRVQEPQGDDLAALRRLQVNPALRTALLVDRNRVWLDSEGQTSLGLDLAGFIEDLPKSSYTDYARFALAREFSFFGAPLPEAEARLTSCLNQISRISAERCAFHGSALLLARQVHLRKRDEKEAGKVIDQAMKLHPDALEGLPAYYARLHEPLPKGSVELLPLPDPVGGVPRKPVQTEDAWSSLRKRVPQQP